MSCSCMRPCDCRVRCALATGCAHVSRRHWVGCHRLKEALPEPRPSTINVKIIGAKALATTGKLYTTVVSWSGLAQTGLTTGDAHTWPLTHLMHPLRLGTLWAHARLHWGVTEARSRP